LLEIPKEKWKHAHRLLQCLYVSVRPLRVEELAEVLAVRFDTSKTPDLIMSWREEDPEDAVLSACSSLIAVVNVEDSWVVQFSHFSVKEFLTSNRLADAQDRNVSRYHIPPSPAHKIMAQACLSTLLQLGDGIDKNGLQKYPLALYAAENWVDHARFGDVSSWIREGMEELFDCTKPHLRAWIWIYNVEYRQERSMIDIDEYPSQPHATPLYYAAACGFRDLAEQLISVRPQDVNARGGDFDFPLHVASQWGHGEVIRLLLKHGADINAKGDGQRTALYLFSHHGDAEIMELLLKNGADIDARRFDNDSPLCDAAFHGRLEAVQLLVEHGADVNVHGASGMTPLCQAAICGALEVVRFLLHHGAGVEARTASGLTALHRASKLGQLEIARLLLKHGADVNAQDGDLSTPLHGVYDQGLEITRLLLEHGADVHARNAGNKTPFQVMSEQRDHENAQLLLEHCAKEE
jgi:ankyrin repeat protein